MVLLGRIVFQLLRYRNMLNEGREVVLVIGILLESLGCFDEGIELLLLKVWLSTLFVVNLL